MKNKERGWLLSTFAEKENMISGKYQEIPLKGMTSTLSDYDCVDGDLMVCHNLANNGAGLQPVLKPEMLTDDEGHSLPVLSLQDRLVFVHKTSRETVYVAENGGDAKGYLWAVMGDEQWKGLPQTQSIQGASFSAVGNVLVMNVPEGEKAGLHYYKWDLETVGYDYLGDKMPDINIRFSSVTSYEGEPSPSMEGLSTRDEKFHYGYDNVATYTMLVREDVELGNMEKEWDDGSFEDGIYAVFNRLQSEMYKQGRFISPFLVRYAFKMYDGTYIMQSSPVLIVPSDTECAINLAYHKQYAQWIKVYTPSDPAGGAIVTPSNFPLYGVSAIGVAYPKLLMYSVFGIEGLGKWKDVIQEVGIFVSSPISKHATSGKLKKTELKPDDIGFWKQEIPVRPVGFTDPLKFTLIPYTANSIDAWQVELPARIGDEKDWVESASLNFTLIKSISIDELLEHPSGVAKPKKDYDSAMVKTSDALIDGYRVRSLYTPSFIHSYNNRLNMAKLLIQERPTFPDGFLGEYALGTNFYTAKVYICEEGVWSVVESVSLAPWTNLDTMSGFFYYPNPSARYLEIGGVFVRLTIHPNLNGAYYFNPKWIGIEGTTTRPSEIPEGLTTVGTVPHPNWVMTSEVDNPFLFPAVGVNAVGSGDILALSTATKAMSEGTAFGTHPLYVFTSEGIYPLAVGETGLFVSTGQPASREVPYNKDAILQIDNSVIFLCERGMMQLDGGRTTLLSGDLQARYATIEAAGNLEKWETIHRKFFAGDNHSYLEAYQFMTYIKHARLAFDYINYRVYVYDPEADVAFVYSLGTKTWSTADSDLKSSIVGYPATLLNVERNSQIIIGQFSNDSTELVSGGKVFYVTRPMKFKMHDILKTVRRVIERGIIAPGKTKYVGIWGTRDFISWDLISAKVGDYIPRISGTPYEAFIVAGWSELDVNMNIISRLSLEVKEKYMNKQR